MNFSIAPGIIPVKELMCNIENVVTYIPEESTDEARKECAIILGHAKLSRPNISKKEKIMLLKLRHNQQIKIVKADK